MKEKMKYYLTHENFLYFNHKYGVDIKNFYGKKTKIITIKPF